MQRFNIALTATGVIAVDAGSIEEALSLVELSIRKGGLALCGRALRNPTAALAPLIDATSKANAPATAVTAEVAPTRQDDHALEVHDVVVDARTFFSGGVVQNDNSPN